MGTGMGISVPKHMFLRHTQNLTFLQRIMFIFYNQLTAELLSLGFSLHMLQQFIRRKIPKFKQLFGLQFHFCNLTSFNNNIEMPIPLKINTSRY